MIESKIPEIQMKIKEIQKTVGRVLGLFIRGRYDRTLIIIRQGEELIRGFQGNLPDELRESHCLLLMSKGNALSAKGYLEQRLKVAKEYLEIAEEYGIKQHIGVALGQIGFYYLVWGILIKF
jgi:hypothetical protein